MTAEVDSLHAKIDALTELVSAQSARLAELEAGGNGHASPADQALHNKLDLVLAHMAEEQCRHQEIGELRDDLIPIANHMIKLSIDELAEIGSEFALEDLLFLLKRLLRDTHMLLELLDRIESAVALIDEVDLIGQQVFNQAVVSLDQMEREGYFTFARGGWRIVEKIVTEFDEEDVNALGDNIVTIIRTVRNLTQPEIMNMTNEALSAIQQTPVSEQNVSMLALLREMSDPKVRKGLARVLTIVKTLADQPPTVNKN
jgi:uncharacterized protein YjgD (DUF1641 family)